MEASGWLLASLPVAVAKEWNDLRMDKQMDGHKAACPRHEKSMCGPGAGRGCRPVPKLEAGSANASQHRQCLARPRLASMPEL
ncbi:hypothetical protein PGT21_037202 [Puccinia graminis f. sp. tritici]|uniref:Uncharacterized protein n=1 Tax=Puccinia graminis f. sp. tritici TaxID=56615 RepID=A0A5B0QLM1_PUCGR|nr:hypothetical protein PGTUg99_022970 [Puccinia graminis f. sp. tritici]KAA1120145.1 hypothetical protein PGT21_037202 [Puccinia graminis f. sp. tritici]